MKFSFSWLKAHLDTTCDSTEIADWLTKIGIEVESIERPGDAIAHITLARIVKANPHPHADRLKVCQVETFDGLKEVVCGAPNARIGLVTAFVAPGQVVPITGEKLKNAIIRQVESYGMLCSAGELCLGDGFSQEGILEFDPALPVGTSLADALHLSDTIFTVSITPNRSDWLSVYGIARDLAAAGVGRLIEKEDVIIDVKIPCLTQVAVDSAAEKDCPYFVGRLIKGIKNGPSPQWLQERLRAAGQKSINAVVDVLNYLLFDMGRPMHAFDSNTLKGSLHVRHARQGESLLALNGKDYQLDSHTLIIADEAVPLSLAGIMGDQASGCTLETTDVFLESAYFDPIQIAKTGRTLNVHSESRFRFERGVDSAEVLKGLEKATHMIVEICGGLASEVVSSGKAFQHEKSVTLNRARIIAYAGLDIPAAPQILEKLGFKHAEGTAPKWGAQPTDRDRVEVITPPWRHDVSIEQDLIEEVLRIYGYDEIPETPLPLSRPKSVPSSQGGIVRRVLAGRGLMEIASWSFIPEKVAQLFGWTDPQLKLINPISQDMSVMRPSLLPGLLTACQYNLDRAQERVALFEVESAYESIQIEGQRLMAAGVRCGVTHSAHWSTPTKSNTIYDVKADVWALVEGLGLNTQALRLSQENLPVHYHPGRSAVIIGPNNKSLGYFGELHPQVAKALSLDKVCYVFEVYVDAFTAVAQKKSRSLLTLHPLLPIERDFAFLVEHKTPAEFLFKAAKKADRKIVDVTLFDVFEGKGIEPGYKSIALRVLIQPQEANLTDADIKNISDAIVAAVEKSCQGKLRT